jgi:TetR/AcrR family transcriptional regulator, regulator of autoinduction and epiphytic fitness
MPDSRPGPSGPATADRGDADGVPDDLLWPADPGEAFGPDDLGAAVADAPTDGRRLRRALNREAVVDALLDLYGEGNLRPSTDEIAERAGISPRSLFRYFEDADDLAGEAVARQQARVLPVLAVEAGPDASFADRVDALVAQRLRLFDTLGSAAQVSRLRAPFQPRLAEGLARARHFLRRQVRTLFAPELGAMDDAPAEAALAAADVLTSYESYQLLTEDQGMTPDDVRAVLTRSLTALLSPGGTR